MKMEDTMIFIPYVGNHKTTRFLPIEGEMHYAGNLLPEFREGNEGYFTKEGETFFDCEEGKLYYRGYRAYAICSAVYDEVQDGDSYQKSIARHGHIEGSTWEKTEEYSYSVPVIATRYRKVFKGIRCEKARSLGYKKDQGTNDWFPLPEGWENELKFYNVEERFIVKYTNQKA